MAFLLFASLLLPLSFAYPGQEIQSRQSLVCNFIGYDLGIKAYNYANDTAIANLDACSRRCLAESPCKSFAFDSGSCLLYNLTTTENARPDSGSPYIFYDRGCDFSAPVVQQAVPGSNTDSGATTATVTTTATTAATLPPASGATQGTSPTSGSTLKPISSSKTSATAQLQSSSLPTTSASASPNGASTHSISPLFYVKQLAGLALVMILSGAFVLH